MIDFTFSIGWAIAGLVIAAAGGAIVFFYRPIAENLANGVSSYEHVKLFGIIAIMKFAGIFIRSSIQTMIAISILVSVAALTLLIGGGLFALFPSLIKNVLLFGLILSVV